MSIIKYIFNRFKLKIFYELYRLTPIQVCFLHFWLISMIFILIYTLPFEFNIMCPVIGIIISLYTIIIVNRSVIILINENEYHIGCLSLNKYTNKITIMSCELEHLNKENRITLLNNSLSDIKTYCIEKSIKQLYCITHRSCIRSLLKVFEGSNNDEIDKIINHIESSDNIWHGKHLIIIYKQMNLDSSFAYLYPYNKCKEKRRSYEIIINI